MITFKKAVSKEDFETGRVLFQKYAEGLGIDLAFQNFESELESISNQYGEPEGVLFLIFSTSQETIGCFGIRKFSEGICELKRMYLESRFRGQGIGKRMMEEALTAATDLNYAKIRLDSIAQMHAAIALYRQFGFYEVEPYRFNPFEDAIYFEKNLR
nr:GNAT family N-acetyltransferase [Allomuricauda sp.]